MSLCKNVKPRPPLSCRKFTIYSRTWSDCYMSDKLLSVPLRPPPTPVEFLWSTLLDLLQWWLLGVANVGLVLSGSFLKLLTKEKHLIHDVSQPPAPISRVPRGIALCQLELYECGSLCMHVNFKRSVSLYQDFSWRLMQFSKINLALLFLSSDRKPHCSNSDASNVIWEPSLKATGSHLFPFLSCSALDFRIPLLFFQHGNYLWKLVKALSVLTDLCESCPFFLLCFYGPQIQPCIGTIIHL